jgi:hypothetical protein
VSWIRTSCLGRHVRAIGISKETYDKLMELYGECHPELGADHAPANAYGWKFDPNQFLSDDDNEYTFVCFVPESDYKEVEAILKQDTTPNSNCWFPKENS